jgi:hypothetical protein
MVYFPMGKSGLVKRDPYFPISFADISLALFAHRQKVATAFLRDFV